MESRKFIPLMYQLAARLGSGQSKENKMFSEILEQVSILLICVTNTALFSLDVGDRTRILRGISSFSITSILMQCIIIPPVKVIKYSIYALQNCS